MYIVKVGVDNGIPNLNVFFPFEYFSEKDCNIRLCLHFGYVLPNKTAFTSRDCQMFSDIQSFCSSTILCQTFWVDSHHFLDLGNLVLQKNPKGLGSHKMLSQ